MREFVKLKNGRYLCRNNDDTSFLENCHACDDCPVEVDDIMKGIPGLYTFKDGTVYSAWWAGEIVYD